MTSEQEIVEQLSSNGFRITQPRRAIIRVLLEADGALTPLETLQLARRHCATVGLVTTYRTLELLLKLGFVRRIHSEEAGCHSYVRASHGHRHELICQRCNRVVEFEGCDLSALLKRVQEETGFTIENHLLELTGICPLCQEVLG